MSQQDVTSPTVSLGAYIKRLSSSLGFNSSPTTMDIELVAGTGSNSQDLSLGATGFLYTEALPGKTARVAIGSLDFVGIIQSWNENWSTAGLTYNVRLADPRILFDCIPVVMNGNVIGTGTYKNVLNVFGYYNDPSGAGLVENGMLFRPVRDYIASGTTTINFFDKKFNVAFGSGFADGSGTVNPNGITDWYRIKSDYMSLNQLLQQVAQDQGFDYYAYIDPVSHTGNLSVTGSIFIETIQRTAEAGSTEIRDFVNNAISSGTLISYKIGQELRPDCGAVVLAGPPWTSWAGFELDSVPGDYSLLPYWGRMGDGSAIFCTDSQHDQAQSGYVLLDYITGSGVSNTLNDTLFRFNYKKYTITRLSGDTYPQSAIITQSFGIATGYLAHQTVLRAALYNQDSWEAMLFKKQQTLAEALGITISKFRDANEYQTIVNNRSEIQQGLSLAKLSPSGVRDEYVNALISAVYEATRTVAEEFYGKQYIAFLPGTGTGPGTTLYRSDWLRNERISIEGAFPEIEYHPVSAAWMERLGGLPGGVSNHELLEDTNNPNFIDELGRHKPFVSYVNYDSTENQAFPYVIDTSVLEPGSYIIEQGNKLIAPITVEQYDKWPEYCIVQVGADIQGRTNVSTTGFPEQTAFLDFLVEMGYTKSQIDNFNLMKNYGDNLDFGLAPPRPIIINCTAETNGVHFPVEWKNRTWGIWSSGLNVSNGGTELISDGDLGPWTFSGSGNLNTAALQTLAKSMATSNVIDSADIVLAGLPVFNLGARIGNNANITAISLQYGVEGLTTSYAVKTFASPLRLSQLLQDKITKVYNETFYNRRQIVNINDRVNRDKSTTPSTDTINKRSEINRAIPRSKNNNEGSAPSFGYLTSTVRKADVSGYYV